MPTIILVLFLLINIVAAMNVDIETALKAKDYHKALWQIKEIVNQDERAGNNSEMYYYLGVAYTGLNRPKLSAAAFEKFFTFSDFDLDQAYRIADNYQNAGDTERATRAQEKILGKASDQKNAAYNLGILYFRQKKYADTIKLLEPIVDKNNNQANPLGYYVGLSYYEQNDNIRAEKYLKLAQDNGYNAPELYYALGNINIQKGMYQEGADNLAYGVKSSLEPVPGNIYNNLGLAYAKINKTALARENFRKAIESGYQNLNTYLNYADNAYKDNRYEELIYLLEPKYNEYEKSSKYVSFLAAAYEKMENNEKAITYYQKLLNLEPKREDEIRLKLDYLRNNEKK